MSFSGYDMIVILGPTASGKTKLAALLASKINGEIISADSRQVYREMNIGTGKDYDDFMVNGIHIPYHLIDIADPGTEFNVFQFQREFITAYNDITSRNRFPILCGGTGMYLDAVLKGYKLIDVPENNLLREELRKKSLSELVEILSSLKKLHSNSDSTDINRTIRAIEIETYLKQAGKQKNDFPQIKSFIAGIDIERKFLRDKITQRLEKRLKEGMIEEVKNLLANGIRPEKLKYYGLEYKLITMYVSGEIIYDEMFTSLNTAIHQFAKRQMTWFRKMEKSGLIIHWINGLQNTEEMTRKIMELIHVKKDKTFSL